MGLLTGEEYNLYCLKYRLAWSYLSECSYPSDEVVAKICELRGYSLHSGMPRVLKEAEFIYLSPDLFSLDKLKELYSDSDLGLFGADGNFLLLNRFIFPIKDMLGNIIALIGWFPDEKKYITTPSKYFSKKCLFYGMEQLGKTGIGKRYFLVEGIFDSLSVRSLGYNCVAMMGITASSYTEVLYSLFNKVVAIPDNDTEGRKVINEDRWKLPANGKYVRITGDLKDIDDIVKTYDVSSSLNEVWSASERVLYIKRKEEKQIV